MILATEIPDNAFEAGTDVELITAINQFHIIAPFPPLSLQAEGDRKEEYQNELRKVCPSVPSVFTGKLEFELRWFIGPEYFYEHGHRADIDNVVKATMDALSGKDGLWVDDTQVEKVISRAVLRSNAGKGWFVCTIDFGNSDWHPKRKPFVEIDDRLCRPSTSRAGQYELGKDSLEADPLIAQGFMGIDRPFLKGHVWRGGFEILSKDGEVLIQPKDQVV
jgi:hypothetical protein